MGRKQPSTIQSCLLHRWQARAKADALTLKGVAQRQARGRVRGVAIAMPETRGIAAESGREG